MFGKMKGVGRASLKAKLGYGLLEGSREEATGRNVDLFTARYASLALVPQDWKFFNGVSP